MYTVFRFIDGLWRHVTSDIMSIFHQFQLNCLTALSRCVQNIFQTILNKLSKCIHVGKHSCCLYLFHTLYHILQCMH